MNTNDVKRYESEFKVQVYKYATDIDPDNEQDWYSLTLGWALAKGLDCEDAHYFANHIRYHTNIA